MRERYRDSVLRELWNSATRTYTAWDAQGVETAQRAFTAAENAEADAYLAGVTRDGNRDTLTTQVGADLAVLRTSIDTLAVGGPVDTALSTVIAKPNNQVSGADTKDVARQCQELRQQNRRLAPQLIALRRLVMEDTSSADTGAP